MIKLIDGRVHVSREMKRKLERDNDKWPLKLVEIPAADVASANAQTQLLMPGSTNSIRTLRSRHFLVQVYERTERSPLRLSINRTTRLGDRWADGITWDDLQRLKSEAGYGNFDAVEIYPRDCDVVNVANVRHLWIFESPIPFAWRKRP